jgi:glycosyltransferase involved in cell wall biosynthesis
MVVTISKVTNEIVHKVAPEVELRHVPHAVSTEIFCNKDETLVEDFKRQYLPNGEGKFIFFWNNRNARRKQSGSLIFWFKEFLDKVGHDKAILLMHTEVKDPNGQDLEAIITELGINNGEVLFSESKMPESNLAMLYNLADCTINIADAEGFGLATLESLACERPIIVTMTGGLQEQVTDGEKWFGVGIEPSSKAIIGSQHIPWIYEDRLAKEDVIDAMYKIYSMSKEERQELGKLGREHVLKNYGFEDYWKKWDNILTDVHEKCGSWDTRKGYKLWDLIEVSK